MNEKQIVHNCPVCKNWATHPINDTDDPQKKFEDYQKYGGEIPIPNDTPNSMIDITSQLLNMLKYSITVCSKCGNVYDSRIRAKLVIFSEWYAEKKAAGEVGIDQDDTDTT